MRRMEKDKRIILINMVYDKWYNIIKNFNEYDIYFVIIWDNSCILFVDNY